MADDSSAWSHEPTPGEGLRTHNRDMTGRGTPRRARAECPQALSTRQVEVLRLLAAGETASAVGRRLGISTSTVARHKQAVFRKLGVQSQAHAVALAIRSGQLTSI